MTAAEDRTECPRCESKQEFKRNVRPVEPHQRWYEAFIRCKICRWELTFGPTTPAIESCRRDLARLNERAKREEATHGATQGGTLAILDRRRANYLTMHQELAERVKRVNDEDTDSPSA